MTSAVGYIIVDAAGHQIGPYPLEDVLAILTLMLPATHGLGVREARDN